MESTGLPRRTALVTGILGQDGSLLAELLLSRGYRVVGVTRPGSTQSASPALAGAVIVQVDLTDGPAVLALLDDWRPDEVYHLAAFHHGAQDGSVSAAVSGKEAMLQTNFLSTRAIAFGLTEAAIQCHLIYAGSSQMYTARQATDSVDELTPRSPSTFYGHTKSWSMDLLSHLRGESGLRASTAILFNHESSRRGAQFVSRKVTRAAAQAARGEHPRLEVYNVATRVDWSSAHDVVDGLSLMGASPKPGDRVVASGALHSVRQLLEAAFAHVGLDWRQFATAREDREAPALVGNPRLLEESLGWQRMVSFEAMVADMVDRDLCNADASGA